MKRRKGISLIVLVVTIIVMIIIAGAIILSFTQTNVIDQAENAVQKHNEASEKDILTLAWGEYMASSISNPAAELKVEGATVTGNGTNGWTVTFTTGSNYTVSVKGEITKAGMQEEPEIDDEKIIEILEGIYIEEKEFEISMEELREVLHIETEISNALKFYADNLLFFTEPNEGKSYNYLYNIDRLYIIESKEVDGEEIYYIERVVIEDNESLYEYANKLKQIVQEFNSAFVGKTVTDIQKKYNEGILEQYVLDNCPSIKAIRAYEKWDDAIFTSIVFEYGNNIESDLRDDNTLGFAVNEAGEYIAVVLGAGS